MAKRDLLQEGARDFPRREDGGGEDEDEDVEEEVAERTRDSLSEGGLASFAIL